MNVLKEKLTSIFITDDDMYMEAKTCIIEKNKSEKLNIMILTAAVKLLIIPNNSRGMSVFSPTFFNPMF
eukprot:snap_masked-scaffold_49-processed-gene-1.37-mRNA-1 protein AED:1.00 eAED:1.00 QI:0/-1/0/0/-1/1/1/0/68